MDHLMLSSVIVPNSWMTARQEGDLEDAYDKEEKECRKNEL